MSQPVILTNLSDPRVATLTLNRPDKRNALSFELIEALTIAFKQAAEDRRRRVVILRGAGKTFCAGLDLAEVSQEGNAERAADALAKLYAAMAESPVVTIAAAQGGSFGGGVGLMAACDIVLATEDLKVGFPEVKRGLVAALITALLRRSMSDRSLRELIVLGATVDAHRAAELQLVNRVVPADQLDSACEEITRHVLAAAPNAVARSKKLLDELAPRPVAEDLAIALRFHLHARHSSEAKEGVRAFLEKREPVWGDRD